MAEPIKDLAVFLDKPPATVVGLAMAIEGEYARPRFGPENGLHVFAEKNNRQKVMVKTSDDPLSLYEPPSGITRRGAIGKSDDRRQYNLDRGVMRDEVTGRAYSFSAQGLTQAVDEQFHEAANALIDEE